MAYSHQVTSDYALAEVIIPSLILPIYETKLIVYLLILGWVTSLLSITPDKTRESSSSPPGIYNNIIPTTTYVFPSYKRIDVSEV